MTLPVKQARPENATILKGSLRNLLDGSRSASIKQFVNKTNMIHPSFMDDSNDREYSMDEYLKLHSQGAALIIYNHEYSLLRVNNSSYDIDFIIVQGETVVTYNANNGTKIFASNNFNPGDNQYYDVENFLDYVSTFHAHCDRSECDGYSNAAILGFDPETGNMLTPYNIWGELKRNSFTEAGFTQIGEEWKKGIDSNESNRVESSPVRQDTQINAQPTEIKQENTIMSKVNTIVAANKSAAVNAAKLEAGNIALKQITKAVAKAMPGGIVGMYAKQYIDTPVGRVIVANLLNVAVEQYASHNPKAKVVADAAMNAAMLEMVQSFNIGEMINEVIANVDISALTMTENGIE